MDDQITSIFDARINHPSISVITGPTMSGKTHFVMQLIENRHRLITQPPENIVWFFGEKTTITQNSKHSEIIFIEGLPEEYDKYINSTKPNLFIFDDLMTEISSNPKIVNLFTRQCHHRNLSIILILQDLFFKGSERKTLLRNATYLTLFSNPLDLTSIFSLGSRICPKKVGKFISAFEDATSKKHGYFFIDGHQNTPKQARFRTDIFKPYQIAYQLT